MTEWPPRTGTTTNTLSWWKRLRIWLALTFGR